MTDLLSPFSTVAKLASECGASWPAFDRAAATSARVEETLKKALQAQAGARLLDPDSSLVFCGSFGRREMVQSSDCDWTLLINGVVSNRHPETARMIGAAINTAGLPSPGTGGTFGNLTFSHELVHRIGGGADSNANLTRRMLMLLESRPVSISPADSSEAVWKAVMRAILERYFEEDVHFSPGGRRKIPRFLLNDLTRYWRTIAVDYAAKHREDDGRKWAIRNAKLRFSRKLLFAAGLAFCLSCQLNPPTHRHEDLFGKETDPTAEPFMDAAMRFASTPPLEFLAAFVDEFVIDQEKRMTVARGLFGSYNEWLSLLGDETARSRLESLSHTDAENDQIFQVVRDEGSKFARGIELLFFDRDRERETDAIAKLAIEYVGF